jgi:hypothetical protein
LNRITAISTLINHNIPVVSAGQCIPNSNLSSISISSTQLLTESAAHLEFSVRQKYSFFENYAFGFVPENSICDDGCYITEKLFDAVTSGVIPIYFGCTQLSGGPFFNTKRIFQINSMEEFSSKFIPDFSHTITNSTEIQKLQMQTILHPHHALTIHKMEDKVVMALWRAFIRVGHPATPQMASLSAALESVWRVLEVVKVFVIGVVIVGTAVWCWKR